MKKKKKSISSYQRKKKKMSAPSFSFIFLISSFFLLLSFLFSEKLVCAAPTGSASSATRNAELVLEQANITSYINTLFIINEPLPDGTPRYGASARLEGCVRPQQFELVAKSIVFISASKSGAKNVTECLSYCAALRRLDYWMQTDVNYQNDVSLYELSSGISSTSSNSGTCWCLPQNMTTVVDLILWSNSILPSSSSSSSSSSTNTNNNTNNNINNSSFNDIFLPPSCCGPQDNPILSNPGATFVDANISASSAPLVQCPSTISASERASLISIFTSSFSCGITSTCGTAAGCVRHPAFKPPISFVQSFDACVPLKYPKFPPDNNNNNGSPNKNDEGLNWDPVSFVILAFVGLFIIIVIVKVTVDYLHRKREEEARERLLRARGTFSGATPQANVSSLVASPNNNNSNNKNTSRKKRGNNLDTNNNNDDHQNAGEVPMEEGDAEDLQARLKEQEKARQLLARLPTSALATRPMEICRQMAAMVLSSAFKTKPTQKALQAVGSSSSPSSPSSSSRCSICLERLDAAPEGSSSSSSSPDDSLSKLPPQIMLPQCGHLFHTYCVHKQLIFKAQKLEEHQQERQRLGNNGNQTGAALSFVYSPACAVCGIEIILDQKVLEQVENVALGKKLEINSNPLL